MNSKHLLRIITLSLILALLTGTAAFADTDAPDGSGAASDTVTEDEGAADPAYTGWTDDNGTRYYLLNGEKADGTVVIDGAPYRFSNGIPAAKGWGKQTVTRTKKVKYKTKKGKTKYKNKKYTVTTLLYYCLGDGRLATGVTKVGSKFYYFEPDDGTPKKSAGFITLEGNTYYCKGNGLLATGWTAVGNNAYYFDKNSAVQLRNTTIGYLKIPESGKLGRAYAEGIRVLDKKGWNLKAAYKYSYKLKYWNRWMRKNSSEDYALVGFTKGKGNCAVMAGTFVVMGKLLGYDIRQVYGRVYHGLPHSWTEIRQGGKTWVYDPNFQNEIHRSGWKIWYGKKGTWKYVDYNYNPNHLRRRK